MGRSHRVSRGRYVPQLTAMPTLNDVLYLVADNGYAKEVGKCALGVNRDAWNDERLLRSIAKMKYRYRYNERRTRLQHAVQQGDASRVALLAPLAGTAVASFALEEGIYSSTSTIEILDMLVRAGADISGTLTGQFFRNRRTDEAHTQRAVRHLCDTYVVSTECALLAGLAAVIPSLVRDALRDCLTSPAGGGVNIHAVRDSLLNNGCGLLGGGRNGRDNRNGPSELELEVARLLHSHPSFTLEDRLCAAGQMNSAAWFQDIMVTPLVLSQLLSSSTPSSHIDAAFWAAVPWAL